MKYRTAAAIPAPPFSSSTIIITNPLLSWKYKSVTDNPNISVFLSRPCFAATSTPSKINNSFRRKQALLNHYQIIYYS